MNLKDRKNELQKIALDTFSNGGQMYRLIKEGYLDHIIAKINDKKTITNSKAIVKKGFLTGNEQFLDILAELLFYFETNFISLKRKEWYLSCMLENNVPEFLLCKKYWGDNSFIPYFEYNMRKLFVENLYENIKFIYYEYEDFFKKLNISDTMSLENIESVNNLYQFVVDLIWCNCQSNQYALNSVFSNHKYRINDLIKKTDKSFDEASQIIKTNYSIHWDMLISKYNKNIDIVKKLIY